MENNRDSSTLSPWQKELASIPGQSQNQNQSPYDVMIIGAGITGITTALLLQQQGKRCIILEGHNIGYGTTGGTTAHINTFFDSTYPEIESDFSAEAAKLVADAGKQALEKIRSLVQTHQIECELEAKTGYLFSETDKETKQLEDILKASQRAGVA
ncbi:MAG: FAD-binding oxidoreductase [Pedobacter sp.]|nr:MAG: FAD-binding oxidoreductase [Pedobacter sp.]